MIERLLSIAEASRIRIPAVQQSAQHRIEEFLNDAATAGVRVRIDRRGKPLSIGEEAAPKITALIRDQLGPRGEVIYRDLSAVAHGFVLGMTSRMRPAEEVPSFLPVEEDVTYQQATANSRMLMIGMVRVCEGFAGAVDRLCKSHGWDATDWSATRTESLSALRRLALDGNA